MRFESLKCIKMRLLCGRGSAPDPAEGAYNTPLDPPADRTFVVLFAEVVLAIA